MADDLIIEYSFIYVIFLNFHNADDDQMGGRRYSASNHAPFQWQRKHCIRNEYDEEHVPNDAFAIIEADPFTNETYTQWMITSNITACVTDGADDTSIYELITFQIQ